MKRKFKVLYTHQKSKKKKVWQDGTFNLTLDGCRGLLYNDSKKEIATIYLNKIKVENGSEFENDKYLIQVEEEVAGSLENSTHTDQTAEEKSEQSFSCAMPARVKAKFSVPRRAQPIQTNPTYDQTIEATSVKPFPLLLELCSCVQEGSSVKGQNETEKSNEICKSSIWSSVSGKQESPLTKSVSELSPSPILPLIRRNLPESSRAKRDTLQLLQLLGDDGSKATSCAKNISRPSPGSPDIELPSFLHDDDMSSGQPARKTPKSKFEASAQRITMHKKDEKGLQSLTSDSFDEEIAKCLHYLVTKVVEITDTASKFETEICSKLLNNTSVELLKVSSQEKLRSDKVVNVTGLIETADSNTLKPEFGTRYNLKETKRPGCSCEQIYLCADKEISWKKAAASEENPEKFSSSQSKALVNDLSKFDLFSSKSGFLSQAQDSKVEGKEVSCQKNFPDFISLLTDSDSLDLCVPDFDFGLTQLQASPKRSVNYDQSERLKNPIISEGCVGNSPLKASSKFYSVSDYDDEKLSRWFGSTQDSLNNHERKLKNDSERGRVKDAENFVLKEDVEQKNIEITEENKLVNATKQNRSSSILQFEIQSPLTNQINPASSPVIPRKVLLSSANRIENSSACQLSFEEEESFSYSPLRSSQLSLNCPQLSGTTKSSQIPTTKPPVSDQRVPNLFDDFKNTFDDESLLLEACVNFEKDISWKDSEKLDFVADKAVVTASSQVALQISTQASNLVSSKLEKVHSKLRISATELDQKTTQKFMRQNAHDLTSLCKVSDEELPFDCCADNKCFLGNCSFFNKSICLDAEKQENVDTVMNSKSNFLGESSFSTKNLRASENKFSRQIDFTAGLAASKSRSLKMLSDQESIFRIGGVFSKQAVTSQPRLRGGANAPLSGGKQSSALTQLPSSAMKGFDGGRLFSFTSTLQTKPTVAIKSSKFTGSLGSSTNFQNYDLMSGRLVSSDVQSRSVGLSPSCMGSPFQQVPKQLDSTRLNTKNFTIPQNNLPDFDINGLDFFQSYFSNAQNSKPASNQFKSWLDSGNHNFESLEEPTFSKWSQFESHDRVVTNRKKLRREWLEEMVAKEKIASRRNYFAEANMLRTPQH